MRPVSLVHDYPLHVLVSSNLLIFAGALIAVGFYRWLGPLRPEELSWTFEDGLRSDSVLSNTVRDTFSKWGWQGVKTGGWVGLSVIGVVAGLVAGVAEALGAILLLFTLGAAINHTSCLYTSTDLGSLDDNLTLPIISGGCLWSFFKLMSLFSS